MQAGLMVTMSLVGFMPALVKAGPLSVVLREGRAHVNAVALEWEAGIVLKRLPGVGGYVACGQDRCAPVQSVQTDGGDVLVAVDGLTKALNWTATFDDQRRHVTLVPADGETATAATPRVGSLAPNLRLVRLDGTPVSLDEFRGQRVLINSWASWWGCRHDLPVWQDFFTRHRTNQFTILSIAVDVQGPEAVTPWVRKYGVTFPVAVDAADVFGAGFGLKAIPVSFLVDEVGIIRLQGRGPSKEFCAQVEEVLREPVSAVRGQMGASPSALPLPELRARALLRPDDATARLALAQALERAGDLSGALAECAAAVRVKPSDATVQFTYGLVLLRQGRTNDALGRLGAARDLDPGNWRIRKQIWALQHPDRFYGTNGIDWKWQQEQMGRERE